MYEHKWLPYHITHGHWMANNIFIYYPMLMISLILYNLDEKSFLCFGVGILIWGLINFGDHFFYTIKDRKVSPGLITGFLFLCNSVYGLSRLDKVDISLLIISLSILIGVILAIAPIGLSMLLHKTFDRYMKWCLLKSCFLSLIKSFFDLFVVSHFTNITEEESHFWVHFKPDPWFISRIVIAVEALPLLARGIIWVVSAERLMEEK